MNILILYDSEFGNTEQIAREIADTITAPHHVRIVRVQDTTKINAEGINLFIVGSPTQGGQPKHTLLTCLNELPHSSLKNIRVACFDTRFLEKDQNFALKLLMKTIGYAAPKIADILKQKGGILIVPPIGFIVNGKKGPIAQGELKRVKEWTKTLLQTN